MASSAVSGERFDMGRVFTTTFSAIKANWQVLLGFSLVLTVVSAITNGLTIGSMLDGLNPADPAAALGMFSSVSYWITVIVGLFSSAFLQSGIIHALIDRDDGAKADFADCFRGGARHFLPLIGLTILWWLGVALGWVLLMVPGLMLLSMWSVSMPALVAENTGVIGAFGRSRALTKGLRWPIFGTLLVFLILYFFLAFAVQGFSATGMLTLYQSNFALAMAVGVISGTVMSVLLTSFLVSLYSEVRLVKEGQGPRGLAEVFS
jgi:hypothetical protein